MMVDDEDLAEDEAMADDKDLEEFGDFGDLRDWHFGIPSQYEIFDLEDTLPPEFDDDRNYWNKTHRIRKIGLGLVEPRVLL